MNWLKSFFYFQRYVLFIFLNIWTLVFTFYFSLIDLWAKWWTYVLRITKNLSYVMIVFQVSLNFDPAKEILKMRCQIYILMKKKILLRKIQVAMKIFAPPFFNHLNLKLNRKKHMVKRAMRKKLEKQSFAEFSKIRVLEIFLQENNCVEIFLNKVAILSRASLLKAGSSTGAFLWNLWHF